MRISDWSSDVCSSDLQFSAAAVLLGNRFDRRYAPNLGPQHERTTKDDASARPHPARQRNGRQEAPAPRVAVDTRLFGGFGEIGRASGRERVCKYAEISVVAVSLKKKRRDISAINHQRKKRYK